MMPAIVNGLPVIALVKLPEVAGYLPHRYVTVCEFGPDDIGGTCVVWTVAWNDRYQGGQWVVTGSGRYDLTWSRAIDLMTEQARDAR
jgi:hypothetical protein